jgi:hypothetical protein
LELETAIGIQVLILSPRVTLGARVRVDEVRVASEDSSALGVR